MDPVKEVRQFIAEYVYAGEQSVNKPLECLGYSHSLLSGLERLKTQVSLSDVIIKVDGEVFHAHRCVLAAVSSYFEAMFTSGFQESSRQEVEIKDISGDVFEVLLNFTYSGRMDDISLNTAMDVFDASMYLQFPLAQSVCSNMFIEALKGKKVSPEDALALLLVAEDHKMSELSEHCYKYMVMAHNFMKVIASNDFLERAPSDLICRFLRKVDIPPETSEEKLVYRIIEWLKYDWENRKDHAADFLKQLRLGLIPEDKVKELIDVKILEVPECKEVMDGLLHNWEEFSGEDDIARLPETFLPRNFVRTVISIGGFNEKLGPDFVNFFDKGDKKWKSLEKFPFVVDDELSYSATVVVNGDIYIAGGQMYSLNESSQTHFFKFDSKNNKWIELPNMTIARHLFSLVHLNGYIYAIGGQTDNDHWIRTVECYNLSKAEWGQVCFLPEDITCPSAAFLDGTLFVYGLTEFIMNYEDFPSIKTFVLLAFDPATQQWTKLFEERVIECVLAPNRVIVAQGDICYRVRYEGKHPDSSDPSDFTPHVNRIEISKLRNGGIRAWIGEEIGHQDAIPENEANAFHINGQVYVNLVNFVYKTDMVLDDKKKLSLDGWKSCKWGNENVVEYTCDLRKWSKTPDKL